MVFIQQVAGDITNEVGDIAEKSIFAPKDTVK
jgi:hypothetical protein